MDIQEGGEATLGIGGQPACTAAATQSKQGRDRSAVARLTTGEQIQDMEALLFVGLTLATEEVLQFLSGFVDRRNGLIHAGERTILSG